MYPVHRCPARRLPPHRCTARHRWRCCWRHVVVGGGGGGGGGWLLLLLLLLFLLGCVVVVVDAVVRLGLVVVDRMERGSCSGLF